MAFERIDEHLEFDREPHRFKLDGRPVPSVTTILKRRGLIDDRWFDDYYANRGRDVHLTCQLYDEHDLDEETLDPILAGYLEGWKRFLKENDVKILEIESPIYSVFQYAGILDRIVNMNIGGMIYTAIIDIKSGAVPWWVGLQLAAYKEGTQCLLDKHRKYLPVNRLAVQLFPDGTWKPHYFKDRHDWTHFLEALSLTHLELKHKKGELCQI